MLLLVSTRRVRRVVKVVNAGDGGQRRIPIGDGDDTFEDLPTPVCRHIPTRDECVGAHATPEVAVLATFERVVVGSPGLVDWASIVRGENNKGVIIHTAILESRHHSPHHVVHVERHGCIEPAVLVVNWAAAGLLDQVVQLLQVRVRDLQWRVDQVERVEEEQGLRRVVVLDHSQRTSVQHCLQIATVWEAIVGRTAYELRQAASRGIDLLHDVWDGLQVHRAGLAS
mmetsp:Transcript_23661/g.74372  ORF Transcript_23661/g.74372 Transcript_23661/m.74372 type:complete len:227 (-) Transcript_23661:939-1619(-)